MGYYLYDHQNRHAPVRDNGKRFWGYPTSRAPKVGIVVHCTAGVEDLDMRGADTSAEATAAYAASTSRTVSWHSASDSDSHFELLPPEAVAFQCRGYNSSTVGHEISKRDMTWRDEPTDWVEATLRQAAAHLGPTAQRLGIPLRKVSKDQLDAAIRHGRPDLGGFIGHRDLDPSRRSDPGADFPWTRFLRACAEAIDPASRYKENLVLFRIDGGKAVYVTNGVVRWGIASREAFEAMNYRWEDVKNLPSSHVLARLPKA